MDLIDVIKMREIKVAITVMQEGSILAAAKSMNITQPAVTRTLRDLEDRLGYRIFNRTHKGTEVTRYGRLFLDRAEAIVGEMHTIQQELDNYREGSIGSVRIGAMPVALSGILAHALGIVLRTEPGLNFTVMEASYEDLMQELKNRNIDLVVGRHWNISETKGLRHEVLFYDIMRLVVREGHPLTRNSPVSFVDLLSFEWILPEKGSSVYDLVVSEFRRRGYNLPKVRAESLSLGLLQALARSSDCIVILADSIIRHEFMQHDLVHLDIKMDNTVNPIGITYLTDRELTPGQEKLMGILRHSSKEFGQ